MKKLLALCIVFALALTLCACGQEAPAEDSPAAASDGGDAELEPITIVFATPNGTANIESVYAAKWIELVEERSEGKITFDYTDSGALGSYTELLEGVQNGVYNMTITEPSYIATYVPESALISLPLIYDSYDEATAILDGEVGQWYNALVAEKSNLEILNYFYCGFRYVCSEKEIDSLDDCKGVLIRSPEIDTYTDLLSLMGFSYVTMGFSEAYTSMDTGIINAVEVPLQNIYEGGFHRLGKYICGTRHLLSVNCIVANEEFMASLPEEYREIMMTALEEVTAEERVQCEANEQDYIENSKPRAPSSRSSTRRPRPR